ncbi:hypothetical protein AMTRI_Chr09g36980 [Amborella trichopoda]|uniref:Late embryogenesis abundant protein LEA-2 subgroup domain-containing protein n=1 Tax=Amborella trichopoda TaxID=13333 RepID=W1NLB0_AMBTC|nr:NDR1/HIN1-like protein 1 [Amborella trichopoda]ERM96617.1 hypothetical protein AMTR_s00001p00271680 [Amborella trichopoda]|eukprot:XP_006829201.1 NDR1/HIN1-like protein 1 [Amborella trichopoda]
MSVKKCENYRIHHEKPYKKLVVILSTLVLSFLSIIFIVWLILKPSKPRFSVQDISIYQLNISSPDLLTSTIQVTVVSKNPNQRVGVYYDNLKASASYKGQQITENAALPAFYQGHDDTNVLSSWLSGRSVPMAPALSYNLGMDKSSGKLLLSVKLDGRLRWKVGSWISGYYHLDIDCYSVLVFPSGSVSGPARVQQGGRCSTNV